MKICKSVSSPERFLFYQPTGVYFAVMNRSQWIALTSAIVLVIACFMPWVYIAPANLIISGVDTEGTRFGIPAYLHFILAAVIILFTFIKKIWAKRFNLMFAALNLAWAIKNYIIMSRCEAGECPVKQTGIYLVLIAALTLLITTFFPNMKISVVEENEVTDAD